MTGESFRPRFIVVHHHHVSHVVSRFLRSLILPNSSIRIPDGGAPNRNAVRDCCPRKKLPLSPMAERPGRSTFHSARPFGQRLNNSRSLTALPCSPHNRGVYRTSTFRQSNTQNARGPYSKSRLKRGLGRGRMAHLNKVSFVIFIDKRMHANYCVSAISGSNRLPISALCAEPGTIPGRHSLQGVCDQLTMLERIHLIRASMTSRTFRARLSEMASG